MSIPVTCDRCLQSFRVKDEFAGRTIRCRQCGAAMAVPWDAGPLADDFVPSRPRKRKRKKRPSAAPKVAAIVVGCLFGVAILGSGIWFAVDQLNKNAETKGGTGSKESHSEKPGAPTSSQPNVEVAEKKWISDPELMRELANYQQVGAYEIRVPKGTKRQPTASRPGVSSDIWKQPSEFAGSNDLLQLAQTTLSPSDTVEKIEQSEINFLKEVGNRIRRVQRGYLSGRRCLRIEAAQQDPNTGRWHNKVQYTLVIGRTEVDVIVATPSKPESRKYKVLDAAARSLRIR
jgi:hypothetical protein